MDSELNKLELLPDTQRRRHERWLLTGMTDNCDPYDFIGLMDHATTLEELEIFLWPFGHGDELLDRLVAMLAPRFEPIADAILASLGRTHLTELAGNARTVGENDWADVVDAVSEVRVIEHDEVVALSAVSDDVDSSFCGVEDGIEPALSDAIFDSLSRCGPAAVSLYCVYGEAFAHFPFIPSTGSNRCSTSTSRSRPPLRRGRWATRFRSSRATPRVRPRSQ